MIRLFSTGREGSTGTTPAPITSPSSDVTPTAICMKCFLAAASARLQNESLRGGKAREETQSKYEEEGGALVFHIRGAAGKKRAESEDKVSDTKSRGKKTVEPLLLYRKMELPAAGEHVFAVESIEKKRIRKVCHKSTEGHFYTHAHGKEDRGLFGFPSRPYGTTCLFVFFIK